MVLRAGCEPAGTQEQFWATEEAESPVSCWLVKLWISILSTADNWMADLAKLKRIRNGHKTHVRKLMHETKEVLAGFTVQPNTDQRQKLKNYRLALSTNLAIIGELDAKILEIDETSAFMEIVQRFLQSLYVDDVAFGDSSEARAYELYIKAKMRLAEGGFNLRKFASNSETLMTKIHENEKSLAREGQAGSAASSEECITKAVTEEDQSYAKSITGPKAAPQTTEKVLGVQWDKDNDTFVLNLKEFVGQTISEKPTKRHVVQVTSRFYDPLGFITPVTVKLKLFCQSLCKKRLDWDEELDEQTKVKWFTLLQALREAEPIEIPRCYLDGTRGEVQSVSLHGFCDASVNAYAAVVYMYLKRKEYIWNLSPQRPEWPPWWSRASQDLICCLPWYWQDSWRTWNRH